MPYVEKNVVKVKKVSEIGTNYFTGLVKLRHNIFRNDERKKIEVESFIKRTDFALSMIPNPVRDVIYKSFFIEDAVKWNQFDFSKSTYYRFREEGLDIFLSYFGDKEYEKIF